MNKRILFCFFIAVLLMLYAGNSLLPVTDNVESNYALTAKEMVLSGDWLSPQIYGRYWFDKPVMFYWLTAGSYRLLGFTDFASRFMPALWGLGAAVFIYWSGCRLFSPRCGFFAALILSSTLMFFAISKLIITDAVLFLCFNATLVFFYLGFSTPHKNYYYPMYICAGLSTLTKGPIGFLLPGLIIVLFLTLSKGWRELKHCKLPLGLLLFLATAAPWYLAMYKLHGQAFLDVFLGTHNALRATVSEHPRDNVFYYYTLLLLGMAFPWVSFLPPALKHFFHPAASWRKPPQGETFLLVSAATVFFFFQNMATKYPTYTYPLLFPLALFLASYLDKLLQLLEPHKAQFEPAPLESETVAAAKPEAAASTTKPEVAASAARPGLTPSTFGSLETAAKPAFASGFGLKGPLLYNTFFCLALAAAALLYKPKGFSLLHPELLSLSLVGGLLWQWRSLLQKKYQMLLMAIAATGLVFNLLLTFCLMLPLTQMRSAKQLAAVLNSTYPTQTDFISYGDYPTSAVYYTGKTILRAIPDSKETGYQPKAFSWSSKNVMPFITYSKLKTAPQPPLILVNASYRPEFRADFPASQWQLQKELPGWEIWQQRR